MKRKKRRRAEREAIDAKHARGEMTRGERRAARELAHLERKQANRAAAALADAGSPAGAQPAVVGA